jgi:hypothetical protein
VSSYEIKIDGPGIFVVDLATKDRDILTGVEKLSFFGREYALSEFGKPSVDFNLLNVTEKKKVIEEEYHALFYDKIPKWTQSSLTFSFAQNPTSDTISYLPDNQVGNYLQEVTRQTFNYLSQIVKLTFSETTNSSNASFRLFAHNMTQGGYASTPTSATAGKIAISSKTNQDTLGEYGVSTVIHELGHALGLDHTSPRGEIATGSDARPYNPFNYVLCKGDDRRGLRSLFFSARRKSAHWFVWGERIQ